MWESVLYQLHMCGAVGKIAEKKKRSKALTAKYTGYYTVTVPSTLKIYWLELD